MTVSILRGQAAVERPARQGRQLSGRGVPGLCRRRRTRPAAPPAVPAPGLGGRPGPTPQDPCARVRGLPRETADRVYLIKDCPADLPYAFLAGDDDFGRSAEFRAELRGLKKR